MKQISTPYYMRHIIITSIVIFIFGIIKVHSQSNADWQAGFVFGEIAGQVNVTEINNGFLYIGGGFSKAGNVVTPNIVKYDTLNYYSLGAGLPGQVTAIAFSGDDVLAASQKPSSSFYELYRWDGTTWTLLQSDIGGKVSSILVDGTDIYIGGQFTSNASFPFSFLAKWDGVAWMSLGSGVNAPVNILKKYGSSIVAAGSFTQAGGATVGNIAAWESTGWTTFGTGASGGSIFDMAVSGNDLYVCGTFNSIDTVFAVGLAKWDGSSWSNIGYRPQTYSIFIDNSDIYIVNYGNNNSSGGIYKYNGLDWTNFGLTGTYNAIKDLVVFKSRIHLAGQVIINGTFHYFSRNKGFGWEVPPPSNTLSESATAIGVFDNDIIVAVNNKILRWSGSQWTDMSTGANKVGYSKFTALKFFILNNELYSFINYQLLSWNGIPILSDYYIKKWNGSAWTESYTWPYSTSFDIEIFEQKIYAVNSSLGFKRWDGMNWVNIPYPGNTGASKLYSDGCKIFLLGNFLVNGSRYYIIKYENDNFTPLAAAPNATTVATSMVKIGSDFYISGNFTQIGGTSANGIARWNGTNFFPLGSGINVLTKLSSVGGALYAAGNFTSIGGIPANRIARWTGSTWQALGNGLNAVPTTIASLGNKIFTSGSFTQAGDKTSIYFAQFNDNNPICPDADADGFTLCDGDCDDTNPNRNPGISGSCEVLGFSTALILPPCGAPNGTATIIPTMGSGNYSYAWSNGQTTPTATDLFPNVNYSVLIADNLTGCQRTEYFNLPASDYDLTLSLTSIQPTCFDSPTGSISANVSGGIPPYIYHWSNGANIGANNPSLLAGNYSVTIEDAYGCTRTASTSLSYQFTRSYILPDVPSVTVCLGQEISFNLVNATFASWSSGGNMLSNTIQPSSNLLLKVNGTSPNNCSFEDSIQVIVETNFPTIPSNMLPLDNVTDLDNAIAFSWSPSTGAVDYSLFVWLASEAQPALPTVSNINSINYIYILPNPNYGQSYNWLLLANGSFCNSSSEIRTFSLKNLPDLTVQSIMGPPAGFSGQSISVSWEIKNVGLGYTGFNTIWRDEVYLSDDIFLNSGIDKLIGSFNNFSALFPGESYNNTTSFTIPTGLSGNFYVIVKTNKGNFPLESDFSNNVVVSDNIIEIILSPNADLRITAASAPQNLFSGQPFPISWTVKNQGIGQTNVSYWEDQVFLTQDTIGFSNPILMTARARNSLLEKDSSYTFHANAMNIPLNYNGAYFLVFETDRSNNVWEFVYENNNRRIIPINILLTPPPDLIVTSVIAPDTLRYGTFAHYQFTVKNQGVGPMQGATRNKILLATNPDTLLAGAFSSERYIQPLLQQGQSSTFSYQVYIPLNLSPGTYFNYVHTDPDNFIFEHSAENNNIGKASNSSVLLAPDLVIENIQVPNSVQPGANITVSWTVRNIGNGSLTNAPVCEYVYLSTSPSSPSPDIVLANSNNAMTIRPGETVNRSYSYSLPCGTPPGTYYATVLENSCNNIIESNYSNNNGTSANPTQLLPNNCLNYDLSVSSVTTTDTITICKPFNVQWSVTNLSASPVSYTCGDLVYLSTDNLLGGDDEIGSSYGYRSMQPGGSYTTGTSISLNNPTLQGNYFILTKYVASCSNTVNDTFPNNDYNYRQVYIKPVSPPDLVVSNLTTPNTSNSGQSILLNYAVSNTGSGPTTAGTWTDKIYLSSDQTLDASIDLLLASKPHAGNLSSGQSYSQMLDVNIPVSVSTGNYYIIVLTDYENYSCEYSNEDNNTSASYIYLIQPAPSDLVVVNIANPANGTAGGGINIGWTVRNIGNNSAFGTLKEAVYLSTDTEWDATDVLLGTQLKDINIPPNGQASFSIVERIGGVTLGDFYIIVRTDILDNINESDDENNGNYGVQPLSVDVPELFIGNPITTNLENNVPLYYRIEIPANLAGETMLVSLISPDSVNAGNQLYLKYATLPTFSDFEFIYSDPLFGNQLITIPSLNTGTLYLLAYGVSAASNPQNIKLEARILPFGISSVNANKGGDNGFVTAEIRGAKFTPDMVVSLQNGTTIIVADTLIFINASKVFARFNLTNKPLGVYDVRAEKTGGEFVILSSGFEIVPGGPVDITVFILHPPSRFTFVLLPTNQPFTISLEFKNESTVDIPIPTVPVKSLSGAPLALSSNELQITGGQLEVQVPLIELNGPPGILRAGGQGSIQLYTSILAAPVFMAVAP